MSSLPSYYWEIVSARDSEWAVAVWQKVRITKTWPQIKKNMLVTAADNLNPRFSPQKYKKYTRLYSVACMSQGQCSISFHRLIEIWQRRSIGASKEWTKIYFSGEEKLKSFFCTVCSPAGSRKFFHEMQDPKDKQHHPVTLNYSTYNLKFIYFIQIWPSVDVCHVRNIRVSTWWPSHRYLQPVGMPLME